MLKRLKYGKEFERLFAEYYNRMYYRAYHYVNDTEISKDIVSDAFGYVWELSTDSVRTGKPEHRFLPPPESGRAVCRSVFAADPGRGSAAARGGRTVGAYCRGIEPIAGAYPLCTGRVLFSPEKICRSGRKYWN